MRSEGIYDQDHAGTASDADYRTGLTVADTGIEDLSAPLASLTPIETKGRQTIYVQPRFGTTGATVVARVVLFAKRVGGTFNLVGHDDATFTATLRRESAAGRFLAKAVAFDAQGATHYEVRIELPSAGTVGLKTWTA